jgi:hypothetical protein
MKFSIIAQLAVFLQHPFESFVVEREAFSMLCGLRVPAAAIA